MSRRLWLPCVLLALAACRPAPAAVSGAGDDQVADDLGRKLRLSAAPARIVSLSPAITETLFAVGCGHKLVLRDVWSDHPAAARAVPSVGGFAPSAEAIVAARPDLLLTTWPPPALRGALDAAGVTWAAFAPDDLAGVAHTMARIGRLCGAAAQGEELARQLRRTVAEVRAAVADRPRPRVFYEMDAGSGGRPYTVGPGSFGHDLVMQAGGENIFAQANQPWIQVSTEAVLVGQPEIIVLADANAMENPQTADSLASRPGWAGLRAVRAGRIHALHTDWVARPGPRVGLGLRQLANILHPGAVAAPPPPDRSKP